MTWRGSPPLEIAGMARTLIRSLIHALRRLTSATAVSIFVSSQSTCFATCFGLSVCRATRAGTAQAGRRMGSPE
jgi:hypothetical protein